MLKWVKFGLFFIKVLFWLQSPIRSERRSDDSQLPPIMQHQEKYFFFLFSPLSCPASWRQNCNLNTVYAKRICFAKGSCMNVKLPLTPINCLFIHFCYNNNNNIKRNLTTDNQSRIDLHQLHQTKCHLTSVAVMWPVGPRKPQPTNHSFYHPICLPSDRLLRGQELPGPFLWVQQRLRRHVILPEQVSLLQGGEGLRHGLRPHQLHGQPILHEEGRVRRLHEHDGNERWHQVLPHDPHGNHSASHSTKHLISMVTTQPVTAHNTWSPW